MQMTATLDADNSSLRWSSNYLHFTELCEFMAVFKTAYH